MRFSTVFLDLCKFLKKMRDHIQMTKFQTEIQIKHNFLNVPIILDCERNSKD